MTGDPAGTHPVLEALRTATERYGLRYAEVVSPLAVDAARCWAARTGVRVPGILAAGGFPDRRLDDVVARQRTFVELASASEVRDYVETLIEPAGRDDESSPSMIRVAVAAAVAELAPGSGPRTVFDPAVGTGAMATAVARAVAALGYTPQVLAQDVDEERARLAAVRLLCHGIDADVRAANSLTTDCFDGRRADLAVADPPFGLSWQRLQDEVWNQYASGWYTRGLPRPSDSTWLFASRMVESLAAGGRAVVFAAPGALTNDAGDVVRKALLADDLLDCVVALPAGLARHTAIPLYALVLTGTKPPGRVGTVRVVDLRAHFDTSRDRRTGTRVLRADALDVLDQALASDQDGRAVRTIPTGYFLRRRVEITREPLRWEIELPVGDDPAAAVARRYGPAADLTWTPTGAVRSRVEVDSLFDRADPLNRWLRAQGWPATRLSTLLTGAPYVLDPAADAATPDVVALPTGQGDATVGAAPDAGGRVLGLPLAATGCHRSSSPPG